MNGLGLALQVLALIELQQPLASGAMMLASEPRIALAYPVALVAPVALPLLALAVGLALVYRRGAARWLALAYLIASVALGLYVISSRDFPGARMPPTALVTDAAAWPLLVAVACWRPSARAGAPRQLADLGGALAAIGIGSALGAVLFAAQLLSRAHMTIDGSALLFLAIWVGVPVAMGAFQLRAARAILAGRATARGKLGTYIAVAICVALGMFALTVIEELASDRARAFGGVGGMIAMAGAMLAVALASPLLVRAYAGPRTAAPAAAPRDPDASAAPLAWCAAWAAMHLAPKVLLMDAAAEVAVLIAVLLVLLAAALGAWNRDRTLALAAAALGAVLAAGLAVLWLVSPRTDGPTDPFLRPVVEIGAVLGVLAWLQRRAARGADDLERVFE